MAPSFRAGADAAHLGEADAHHNDHYAKSMMMPCTKSAHGRVTHVSSKDENRPVPRDEDHAKVVVEPGHTTGTGTRGPCNTEAE
jgi:hypothetical protein